MSVPSRRLLATTLAAACVLAACKEPAPPIDFTPLPAANVTIYANAGPSMQAPTEMSGAQRAVAITGGGRCNLERIDLATIGTKPVPVSKAAGVTFTGWIVDPDTKTVPAKAHLRFVDTSGSARVWMAPIAARRPRADVRALLGGDAAYAASGYVADLDLATLPDGAYRVYVVFVRGDALVACDNGRAITLGP